MSDRTTRYLLACGLGPGLFIAVILLEGALRPGYNALHHWGSELSLGERGWIQVTNFIVTGILTILFAVGLRRTLRPGRAASAGPFLTGLFGLCLIVAGVFVTDPKPGYPPGFAGTAEPTLHGIVHDLNALPSFAALIAATLALSYRFGREPGGRPWMWYSVLTGLGVLVTFVASGALYSNAEAAGTLPQSMHGLMQRITIVLGFGWFSVLAVRLLHDRRVVPAPQKTQLTASMR